MNLLCNSVCFLDKSWLGTPITRKIHRGIVILNNTSYGRNKPFSSGTVTSLNEGTIPASENVRCSGGHSLRPFCVKFVCSPWFREEFSNTELLFHCLCSWLGKWALGLGSWSPWWGWSLFCHRRIDKWENADNKVLQWTLTTVCVCVF